MAVRSAWNDASWPPGLYPVRGALSIPHVLVDSQGVILLDTGFPGDARRIRRKMAEIGAGPKDVRAILLTHGHIDHAGNLAWAKEWTGAPVYAHPLEQAHLDGKFPYSGAAQVCGVLEAAGRLVTRYRPAKIDVEIKDGDELPFWGGLRVVHLPGHTLGHCGFYSEKHRLLFSGDLWVRFMMRTQLSPRIFSSAPELVRSSLAKVRALNARRIIPGHYAEGDAGFLRARFEELCDEIDRRGRPGII